MRKVVAGGVAVLAIAILALAGGDPWKSKPYQQWDDKDLRRIMNDSPWAKVIQVTVSWRNVDPTHSEADTKDLGGGGGSGSDSDMSHPSSLRQPGEGLQVPQARFLARWMSSRTLREAVVRAAVIDKQLKEDAAEKQLAVQVETYEVVVLGEDMKPFQGLDEKALAEKTYLQTKKTKQKIVPVRVEIARSKDGKSVEAVAFLFAKKSATGESTIPADEKGIEFNCSPGRAKIQTTFDIAKMEDTQGRDL